MERTPRGGASYWINSQSEVQTDYTCNIARLQMKGHIFIHRFDISWVSKYRLRKLEVNSKFSTTSPIQI